MVAGVRVWRPCRRRSGKATLPITSEHTLFARAAILAASADVLPPLLLLGSHPPGDCPRALLPAAARGILVLDHCLSWSARRHHLHRRRDRSGPRPAPPLVRRFRPAEANPASRSGRPAESRRRQL